MDWVRRSGMWPEWGRQNRLDSCSNSMHPSRNNITVTRSHLFPCNPAVPSHCSSGAFSFLDSGLGHLTCPGQWDASRRDTSRGWKCACAVGLALLCHCSHHEGMPWLACQSQGEDKAWSPANLHACMVRQNSSNQPRSIVLQLTCRPGRTHEWWVKPLEFGMGFYALLSHH